MADDDTASVKRVLSDDNASLEDKLKAIEQIITKIGRASCRERV